MNGDNPKNPSSTKQGSANPVGAYAELVAAKKLLKEIKEEEKEVVVRRFLCSAISDICLTRSHSQIAAK